ncbi:probable ribonuclease ZC3H12C isoform X3 [Hyposmocoma kahamanoa]|uniref:probable ribonuclease ZC3H12C isoform X3 n=1 Tax=Hyposmocoma kahamanoa TaxID=1477025 RepID=UPI000E6D6174|nr:probable ribonuclease ZC3H12C isoform X3 [Hyposmocoma kahamanoa]
MGKPTSRRSKSSASSSSTNRKDRMNSRMSIKKIEKRRKKTHNKTNNNIKKLFEKLRRDSNTSLESDNTVVAISYHGTETSPRNRLKRKMESDDIREIKQRKFSNSSCIIIDDGDLITNNEFCNASTPFKAPLKEQCSTPIKTETKVNDLIISTDTISGTKLNNNSMIAQNFNKEVADLTKEINADSYLTIDLTNETVNSSLNQTTNTVIDLANQTDNDDCTLISISDTNLSMSGESDVTVLNMAHKKQKHIRKFARGIAKLDASEKGRLLELITQNIFSGCSVPKMKQSKHGVEAAIGTKKDSSTATETVQDSYIKEVILGQASSRNSIGSNIYNPARDAKIKTGLRMIVIDGSNVAMQCKFGKSTEPRLLDNLERRGLVVYTPSREIQGRMVTSYDDRYIVQCAAEFDGVIVSGDNYRDLLKENPRWRFVIENRLLPFTWVHDMIMFPKDPLGRNGPTLEQFLKHPNREVVVSK